MYSVLVGNNIPILDNNRALFYIIRRIVYHSHQILPIKFPPNILVFETLRLLSAVVK